MCLFEVVWVFVVGDLLVEMLSLVIVVCGSVWVE